MTDDINAGALCRAHAAWIMALGKMEGVEVVMTTEQAQTALRAAITTTLVSVDRLREDLGICVGCGKAIRVGDVVTPWDDEVGHADCENPPSLTFPELPEDTPPAQLLIGNPAQYLSVDSILAALSATGEACRG